jgi:ubiquinone/menaquinone biosynthesis C-methylase UbiE
VAAESGTWHHGLVARWWGEFTEAEPEELAYFRAAIKRFGEPVLDAGCGSGRILVPLLADGFDIDGSDISADMIAQAEARASNAGYTPRLVVQPMHELELGRTYRTIYMCGAFGIGSTRAQDREALQRAYRHLEPGGALLIANHELPYATSDAKWAQWIPGARQGLKREWQTEGERRATSDGDEIEWLSRPSELDPLEQRATLQVRIRLRHGGEIVKEEAYTLTENLYFAQEILLLLDEAGFRDAAVEAGYTGRPATADDGMVAFTAIK